MPDFDYDHRVINHEHGFGHGIHTTNHIERFWGEYKKLADFSHGFNAENIFSIEQKVSLTLWRWRNKNNNLIEALALALV